jgi:hypothetical protein
LGAIAGTLAIVTVSAAAPPVDREGRIYATEALTGLAGGTILTPAVLAPGNNTSPVAPAGITEVMGAAKVVADAVAMRE